MKDHTIEVSLFGCGLDTGNLGVSALTIAFSDGLLRRIRDVRLMVFDHSRGLRDNGRLRSFGARWSRRIYQQDTLINIRLAAFLGGAWNEGARSLLRSAAVFDISGGDSFSDMYGLWRYKYVNLPKIIALQYSKPLILLPQTYGPFATAKARRIAERIVRSATQCWARDERSFEPLKELLGDAFDPHKHRCGVDLAFRLDTARPDDLSDALTDWLDDARRDEAPICGLNVSGLIFNQPERAAKQYGLLLNYPMAVSSLLSRLLDKSEARVLLVPHVAPIRSTSLDDDARACNAVLEAIPKHQRDRIRVAQFFDDPRQMKWIISQCDWFCGTRMHSTIAALSTGVPCATLAYSGKAQGVFETCDQGAHVADMRRLSTDEAVEQVWRSWTRRADIKASLASHMPDVVERAESQMDEIVAAATGRCAEEFATMRKRKASGEQAA